MANQVRRPHFYSDTILPKFALIKKKTVNLKRDFFHSHENIDQEESPLHRVRNTGKCAVANELRTKPRRSRVQHGHTRYTHSTSALNTDEWSASRPRPFYPWDNSSCRKLDRLHCQCGRCGEKKNSAVIGIEPWFLRSSNHKPSDYIINEQSLLLLSRSNTWKYKSNEVTSFPTFITAAMATAPAALPLLQLRNGKSI